MFAVSFIIFLIVILYTFVYVRFSYKNNNLKIFDYFLVWFAFIYALIPMFFLYDKEKFMLSFYKDKVFEQHFFYEGLIVLLSFICCIIGYNTYNKKGYILKTKIQNLNSLYQVSLVFFFLSILSYSYFLTRYGGVSYLIENVSSIRSGTDENKDYLGAFVKMFSNLIIYAFIIQIFLFHKNFFRKKLFTTLFFYILIFLLFAKSLLDGGRAGIISLIIYILLSSYYLQGKVNKKMLIIGGIVGFFVIIFGKTYLFSLFSSENSISFEQVKLAQQEKGFLNLFIYEFNHQFLSLSNFIRGEFEFRYFKDYFIWLFKPMKLVGGGEFFDSIAYYNTYMLIGDWDSNIPPGFVALGYINGGIIGLVIQSLITGRVLRIIDKTLKNSNFRNNGLVFLLYLYLFNYTWYALQNGDIAIIIQSGLVFWVIFLYLLFKKKILIRRMI